MTKDYALFLLNQLCIGASVEAMSIIPQFELAQALSVAIKALEQEDVLDKIRAEILENAFSVVNPKNTYEYINVLDLGNIEKIIDKYRKESEGEKYES